MNLSCISTILPNNYDSADVKQTHIAFVEKKDIIFFLKLIMLKI